MITNIAHVCLGASDLEQTERFYCGGLGLKKVFDFIRGGKRIGFYLEVRKGQYVEVFRRDSMEAADRHPLLHICFETEDLDALRAHMASQGIGVTDKKLGADQSWQAWTKDPNGVNIEFHQYTHESCQVTGANCNLD